MCACAYVRGQGQLLDVIDANQLSNTEAAQVLEGPDAAESGHRIQ